MGGAVGAGRMFSVLFSSFWLALYYLRSIAPARDNGGAFRLLMETTWHGPRIWEPGKIDHYEGHCYVIRLDRPFVGAHQGVSVLTMLENGVPLARPHTTRLREIVEQGGGRYIHLEDKIFFSPSDNARPEETLRRPYQILESVVADTETNNALLRLNHRRANYDNVAVFGLEKLATYLGDRVRFSGLVDHGGSTAAVRELEVNLTTWHLGVWRVSRFGVAARESQDGVRLTLELDGIESPAIPEAMSCRAELGLDRLGGMTLHSFRLESAAGELVQVACDWMGSGLRKASVKLGAVGRLRAALAEAVGGGPFEYESWLEGFLASWSNGELGLPCELSAAERDKLCACLSPKGRHDTLWVDLVRDGQRLRLRCRNETCAGVEESE